MKGRYAIGGIVAVVLLAMPCGVAAAQGGGQAASLAAQQCKQERAEIGKKAFRKRYGAKHGMRSCSKRMRPQVTAALSTAGSDCQAELAQIGLTQFILEYGEDLTDTLDVVMAECIAEDVDGILNPGDDEDDEGDDDPSNWIPVPG
jgi:hypothetical protein